MGKTIKGSMRLFHKESKGYGIEMSKDMDDADILVFAGMIIEVLAHKHKVTQEKMAEQLIDGNKTYPMTFDDEK